MQAVATTPLAPKAASTVITPNALRGLTVANQAGAIGSSQRAAVPVRTPTDSRPVKIGDPVDLEAGFLADEGFIEEFSVGSQVKKRVGASMQRIQNALNEAFRKRGRLDLSSKQKGALLRGIFQKRLNELKAELKTQLEKGEVTLVAADRERGDMPRAQAYAIRKYALGFLSERLLKVVARRKLPRIVLNRTPKGRPTGYWDREENVFYLPEMNTPKARAVILRVFAKYFDSFAHNGEAAVTARNQSLASDTVYNVNGELYLDTATPSFYSGRLYGQLDPKIKVNAATGNVSGVDKDETENEWSATAFEALADGFEFNLGFLWENAPRHLAFLMSYIEGQFV